jgi:hypothetical protein
MALYNRTKMFLSVWQHILTFMLAHQIFNFKYVKSKVKPKTVVNVVIITFNFFKWILLLIAIP